MAKVRKAAPAAAIDDEDQTPPAAPAQTKAPPMAPQPPMMAKGEDDEEEEGDEGDGDMEKAEFSQEQLDGAMDLLEKAIEVADPNSRKKALLKKSYGGKLSKSENEELIGLLSGQGEPIQKSLADRTMEPIVENDDLQKAIDVSDYLTLQQDSLEKSLRVIADGVEGSRRHSHEFNVVMAKGLLQLTSLCKSMKAELTALSGQPARAPKSKGAVPGVVTQGKPLEKSFANTNPEAQTFSKSQVLDALEVMTKSADSKNQKDRVNTLVSATALYEQTGRISKSVLDEATTLLKAHTN